MGCFDTADDLYEKIFSLFLSEIVLIDVLVQIFPCSHLHDDVDIGGGVEDLIEFNYVGVIDEFQYSDLALHLRCYRLTLEIIFLFLIRALLMILTATLTPVSSWRAAE